jgi:dTDP-L-rhamnose 4-epimerase
LDTAYNREVSMGRVLVTGGAGFIGGYVGAELLRAGWQVRALDNLSPQVHGRQRRRPDYLNESIELQIGDVRDPDAVREALEGVDAVIHLAALVGVGQSMYQMAEYTSVNNLGTAVLLEALAARPVARLVVASSMSVYGEGAYVDARGRRVMNAERSMDQVANGRWEPIGDDGEPLTPQPTAEDKPPSLASVYALSKYDQERLCLVAGRAYRIPTLALRLFNVFGPHQALSNPYTGVLAIFAARLLNQRPPLIFEDGRQRRDFVSVHDVARAFRLALESPLCDRVLNIGSGRSHTVLEVARSVAEAVGQPKLSPTVTGRYRVGDIRHCFADVSAAAEAIHYRPEVTLESGLGELAEWLEGQVAVDRVEEARAELEARGLTR